MDAIAQSIFSWGFVGVQLLGLVSMGAARLRVSGIANVCWQLLFFMCLVGVGVATMLAIGEGSDRWLASGTTLSLMAVGAVAEFGRANPAPLI